MKISLLVSVALLVCTVNAYSGPYAAVTFWHEAGCNATAYNYVTSVYVYRADGNCFHRSGSGLGDTWRIYVTNDTTVSIGMYQYCTDGMSVYYPIDACPSTGFYQVSIFQTMPSNEYWSGLALPGQNGTWETVLSVDYYYLADGCQNDSRWVDREIIGWPECKNGNRIYCQNNEIHYDTCTSSTCGSGCTQGYAPLENSCTNQTAASYWSTFIDIYSEFGGEPTNYFYQSSCTGYSPQPSTSPVPSAIPSSSPTAAPGTEPSRTPTPSATQSSVAIPSASPSTVSSEVSSSATSPGVWMPLMVVAVLLIQNI